MGESGIGIVRLSGKKALSIADGIFTSKDKSKPSKFKTHTIHYGHVTSKSGKKPCPEMIDEALLAVMKSPKSYTREDVVEINCHSGIVALRKILNLVIKKGARLAEPGEFTKRAFINGRLDLAQAEAVLDVIRSKTESSMKVAISQLEGGLSKAIRRIKKEILEFLGEMEARIDFSEEDIKLVPKKEIQRRLAGISGKIKKLLEGAEKGMILKEGIMCVICGKPNTGKSSLMNSFLKRNRVIVTPMPGTTRDAIEEEVSLKGIPVRFVDTAGISVGKDIAEKHGIKRSRSYIKKADLVIFMLDYNRPWSKTDGEIFKSIKKKNFIAAVNKIDLKRKLDVSNLRKKIGQNRIAEVSLLRKKNVDRLEKHIVQSVWRGKIKNPEGAFITNLRHEKGLKNAGLRVKKAEEALKKDKAVPPEIVASDLREAVLFLGSVLGDTVEPDILDRIFSKFCIGK